MSFRERFRKYSMFVQFLYYFIFWLPMDYFIFSERESWKESIISSLIYSVVLTLVSRSVNEPRAPLYFKRVYFERVREEIESRGWQLKREKENVRIYKQPNSFWLFAPKIKLTLSPFYACVEVPERYREEFLKTISELNAKLY